MFQYGNNKLQSVHNSLHIHIIFSFISYSLNTPRRSLLLLHYIFDECISCVHRRYAEDGRRQIVKSRAGEIHQCLEIRLYIILEVKIVCYSANKQHTITQTTSLCALFYVRQKHRTTKQQQVNFINFSALRFFRQENLIMFIMNHLYQFCQTFYFFSTLFMNWERLFAFRSLHQRREFWWNIYIDTAQGWWKCLSYYVFMGEFWENLFTCFFLENGQIKFIFGWWRFCDKYLDEYIFKREGWGEREMANNSDSLMNCFRFWVKIVSFDLFIGNVHNRCQL